MDKILHFVLSIVKKTLLEQDYRQVGRLPRFYEAKEKREVPNENLIVWPGYECNVKCFNDGIFLNVDTVTRFLNRNSIYEKISLLRRDRYSSQEIKEYIAPSDPTKRKTVVITAYNSRLYQIDDLTYDFSPKTYIFNWTHEDLATKDRKQMKTNIVDYFFLKYQIKMTSQEEN